MAVVVITGAGGFLGTQLTRTFLAAGHTVRAADLKTCDLSLHAELGAQPAVADVTDPTGLRVALEGAEIVVHAAGIFDLAAESDLLHRVNAEGARTTAQVAADVGAKRFVLISSTSVYGRSERWATEEAPARAKNAYGRSKWAGEQAVTKVCAERGLPLSVLRPTLLYGPGSRYGLAPFIAILALRRHYQKGLPIARGGPLLHLVHVDDVARAALLAATDPAAVGVFNLADDAPICAGDLLRVLAARVGVEIGDRALPWVVVRYAGPLKPLVARIFVKQNQRIAKLWARLDIEPAIVARLDVDWMDFLARDNTFDTSRLRAVGFTLQHPDARDGLSDTIDWYRAQRWIPA